MPGRARRPRASTGSPNISATSARRRSTSLAASCCRDASGPFCRRSARSPTECPGRRAAAPWPRADAGCGRDPPAPDRPCAPPGLVFGAAVLAPRASGLPVGRGPARLGGRSMRTGRSAAARGRAAASSAARSSRRPPRCRRGRAPRWSCAVPAPVAPRRRATAPVPRPHEEQAGSRYHSASVLHCHVLRNAASGRYTAACRAAAGAGTRRVAQAVRVVRELNELSRLPLGLIGTFCPVLRQTLRYACIQCRIAPRVNATNRAPTRRQDPV